MNFDRTKLEVHGLDQLGNEVLLKTFPGCLPQLAGDCLVVLKPNGAADSKGNQVADTVAVYAGGAWTRVESHQSNIMTPQFPTPAVHQS